MRVEADGYVPATSPQVEYGPGRDETPVAFDAKLVRDAGTAGVALAPDGKPAAGADIVVATPDTQTMLKNGRMSGVQNTSRTLKADEAGRFTLAPSDGDYTLLVLHDAGFAKIPRAAFEKETPLRLQPWARVEGVLKIGPNPAANEQVGLNDRMSTFERGQPRVSSSAVVKTDAEGRFVFDRVFPGEGNVGRYVMLGAGRGRL